MTDTTQDDHVWQKHQVAQGFLDNVRGAIPLAAVQIECLLRLIQQHKTAVKTFLDLGCGDGILGRAIAKTYPTAQGIGLDFSEAMLNAAKNHPQNSNNLHFIQADFGQENWQKQSLHNQKFDVIVSGFAIHHQPDKRKKELYKEIYQCLNSGGIFLNLEHVASHSPLGEKCFDEIFVDSLYQFHQQKNTTQNRTEIREKYYSRADKIANILAPVESQCQWLREIGYNYIDCY